MTTVQDPSSLANNLSEVVLSERDVSLIRERLRAPRLALRSDGAWILSVDELPAGTDFTKREVWTGIVLTEAERELLKRRLANAEAEAAALLAGRIAKPPSDDDPDPA